MGLNTLLNEEFGNPTIRHSIVMERLDVLMKFFLFWSVFFILFVDKLVRFHGNAETQIVRKLGVFDFISRVKNGSYFIS